MFTLLVILDNDDLVDDICIHCCEGPRDATSTRAPYAGIPLLTSSIGDDNGIIRESEVTA